MSLNIVFMGTPEFSVPTLHTLIKNKFDVFKVYTQPPKKSKRGQKFNPSPIEEFCKKNKISFNNPPNLNSEEELKIFKKLSPDIVVVVAYGQIIPKSFLDIVKFGFINIHASLLPKWRGAAPIQRAIMNGDKKIGVSIMKIKEKLDSGPVLMSKELELDQNATHGEMEKNKGFFDGDLVRYDKDKKISERAITSYKVLDKNTNSTLLILNPVTGRKHQIRKQLFSIGFPVIGDSKYNFPENKINKYHNLMLHAYSIKFMINEKKYEYSVNIPAYFKKMLLKKRLTLFKNS